MEQSQATQLAISAPQRWWQSIVGKPAGELALDLALFVLGVTVLYAIDLTIIRDGAPVAVRYIIDLVIYVNHHAMAAVQMLY